MTEWRMLSSTEICKIESFENLGVKYSINTIRKSLDECNSKFNQSEERISELKLRENIQAEALKCKKLNTYKVRNMNYCEKR